MAAVRSGYRRLWRASRATFKGDTYALKQASITLKDEFLRNKHVTSTSEIADLLRGIDEVEEMLKFNIVQGVQNSKGNFEVKLSSEHQVTVSAAQDEPHGVEIQPVDPSYSGRDVQVEKAKPSKDRRIQKENVIIEDL